MSSKEYCMYLRKSRSDIEAEARGEGETLARHENILLELAKRLKLNVESRGRFCRVEGSVLLTHSR